MSKRCFGIILAICGVICVISSLVLVLYNNWDDRRAGETAGEVLESVVKQMPSKLYNGYTITDESTSIQMPMVVVDGNTYVGTLEIESIGISLPVLSEWNDKLVKIAPCKYAGSAYDNSMIIAAHNYSSHFGKLYMLESNDVVVFKDVNGNMFCYRVLGTEIIDFDEIEQMNSGDWDLTLFTCTKGGKQRITIRCESVNVNQDFTK